MKKTIYYVVTIVMSHGMFDTKVFEDYDKLCRWKQIIQNNTDWKIFVEEKSN